MDQFMTANGTKQARHTRQKCFRKCWMITTQVELQKKKYEWIESSRCTNYCLSLGFCQEIKNKRASTDCIFLKKSPRVYAFFLFFSSSTRSSTNQWTTSGDDHLFCWEMCWYCDYYMFVLKFGTNARSAIKSVVIFPELMLLFWFPNCKNSTYVVGNVIGSCLEICKCVKEQDFSVVRAEDQLKNHLVSFLQLITSVTCNTMTVVGTIKWCETCGSVHWTWTITDRSEKQIWIHL